MSLSIGTEFMSYYKQQRLRALIGIDDWSDRLNYFYTVIVLSICITVVTVKTYFLNPLACHCPTVPTGAKFGAFLTETCFTQGTVPMRPNETLPQTDADWARMGEERLKNYYYWVPFMLGLQLILFYLPDMIWRSMTYNKLGINLQTLMEEANNACRSTSVGHRQKMTSKVAESMRLVLFAHRNLGTGFWSEIKLACGRICGILMFSKRLGTWTVASYFFIKILYLANAAGQIFLMRKFLGFDQTNLRGFGLELAKRLSLKDDWRDTLYFPRLAFCRVEIRLLGSQNSYVSLCTLPVNLFNEKIYVFLWFWVLFVATCTLISIPMWILSLGTESRRIHSLRRYFRLDHLDFDENDVNLNPYKKHPRRREDLQQFIDEFLRFDGLFILEIISKHVGDVVTGEIVRLLWTAWVKEYADRHDFRRDDWRSVNDAASAAPDASMTEFTPQPSNDAFPTINRRAPSSVKSGHI